MDDKKTYPISVNLTQTAGQELGHLLKKYSPLHIYEAGSKLFYEAQTPIVAYLLIEGEVSFKQNGKLKDVVTGACLIGLAQMVKKKSSNLSAEITKKSKIYYLDKSHFKELFAKQDVNEIKDIIKNLEI